jgi:hypothetical protein
VIKVQLATEARHLCYCCGIAAAVLPVVEVLLNQAPMKSSTQKVSSCTLQLQQLQQQQQPVWSSSSSSNRSSNRSAPYGILLPAAFRALSAAAAPASPSAAAAAAPWLLARVAPNPPAGSNK